MAILSDGRQVVNVTANKTLALADCGIVQNVTVDALTLTLPVSAAGLNYIIRVGGAAPTGAPAGAVGDASIGLVIAPNGTDTVGGVGITPAAGKGLTLTKATGRVGDQVKLQGGAAGSWVIEYISRDNWIRTP